MPTYWYQCIILGKTWCWRTKLKHPPPRPASSWSNTAAAATGPACRCWTIGAEPPLAVHPDQKTRNQQPPPCRAAFWSSGRSWCLSAPSSPYGWRLWAELLALWAGGVRKGTWRRGDFLALFGKSITSLPISQRASVCQKEGGRRSAPLAGSELMHCQQPHFQLEIGNRFKLL